MTKCTSKHPLAALAATVALHTSDLVYAEMLVIGVLWQERFWLFSRLLLQCWVQIRVQGTKTLPTFQMLSNQLGQVLILVVVLQWRYPKF
jgi:hypothetical protein